MQEDNLGSTESSYNAAISACGAGEQWQLAVRNLQHMREADAVPEELRYSSTISACAACAQWQQALQVLAHLQ